MGLTLLVEPQLTTHQEGRAHLLRAGELLRSSKGFEKIMSPMKPFFCPVFLSVFLLQTVFVAFQGANCEPLPRARAPYHMWYPSSVGQGAGFPRDRRIPYHMPGLMDALRTFGVGYKRQGDSRGKRAVEEEMGLIFPPAFIHDNAGNYWSAGDRDGE